MTVRGVVFFCWVQAIGGPRPLKVCSDPLDEPCFEEKLKHHVLSKHPLHPHEALLSFPQLEALYPPPREACN